MPCLQRYSSFYLSCPWSLPKLRPPFRPALPDVHICGAERVRPPGRARTRALPYGVLAEPVLPYTALLLPLPCHRLALALAGARVRLCPLAAYGQTPAVTNSTVASDVHEPLDVE